MSLIFQSSDVPLTEDVIKQEKPFIRNYFEWLSDRGEIIELDIEAAGAALQDVYLVPDNHTFYITDVIMRMSSSAGFLVEGLLYSSGRVYAILGINSTDTSITNLSHSYTLPIKIEQKTQIKWGHGNANTNGRVILRGFLISKKILGMN